MSFRLDLNFQLDLFGQSSQLAGSADAPTVANPTPDSVRPARTIVKAVRATGQPIRVKPLRLPLLAEKVAEAWYRYNHHGDDIHIPVGTVAALTLLRQRDPEGPDLQTQFMELSGSDLLETLRQIWEMAWLTHPYRVELARPLHDWLNEPKAEARAKSVREVVHAALKSGLFAHTGEADPEWRCEVDPLGPVLTEFRSPGARKARGEYHTPVPVADFMADLTLGMYRLEPGNWVLDPAGGTGGMLRAAALAMRRHNLNPHDYGFSMGELCPIAAGCAAVNSIVWDLGPNVLIYVGNTLAEGDHHNKALEHRKAVLKHYERQMEHAKFTTAALQALALLEKICRPAA